MMHQRQLILVNQDIKQSSILSNLETIKKIIHSSFSPPEVLFTSCNIEIETGLIDRYIRFTTSMFVVIDNSENKLELISFLILIADA